MSLDIDKIELKKVLTNKKIFSIFKDSHIDIENVLKLLDANTLPTEIPINNNVVFIRDLSNYVVNNDIELKPYIGKYQ